jgi:hypothetical protein
MFAVTGHLALGATGTQWRVYWRVQLGAIVAAAFTGAIALVVRLLLAASHFSDAAIALIVLAAAAVPWSLGMLWTLSEPEFASLRAGLPRGAMRLVETLGGCRGTVRERGRRTK